MNLSDIKKVPLARKRAVRVGRGSASGNGKTCGRGSKGQRSRSGASLPVVFEGGTMPFYRRIPKRGFNNKRFQKNWLVVNVKDLNGFSDGQTVTTEDLVNAGIVRCRNKARAYLKVLGTGDLKVKNLTIKAHKVSKAAQEKLDESKSSVKLIPVVKEQKKKKKK